MLGVGSDRFDHQVEFIGAIDFARHAIGLARHEAGLVSDENRRQPANGWYTARAGTAARIRSSR